MDHAAKGKKALDASNFDEAIKEYTAALQQSPESPDYYIRRSTAYQRAKNSVSALEDAERGVVYAHKRAKRELIIEAQFRRGCALYSLSRFGDAKFAFELVKKSQPEHKMVPIWLQKITTATASLSEDDDKRKCTIQELPTLQPTSQTKLEQDVEPMQTSESSPAAAAPVPSRREQIRQEWYQNTQHVVFSLLAKGVSKDTAQVEILERSLSINFPLPDGASYDLTLDPLYASVQPSKCTTNITPTKIVVTLAKLTPGQKWAALEGDGKDAAAPSSHTSTTTIQTNANVFKNAAPVYPTSSRSGPKNWDKVVQDIRETESKEAGKDTPLNDDDDDEGGDPTNAFFKKLYKGASPDVQRAMMKSYTESNGTALSTNWEEVSKGKVETSPPDGMEAKNW